MPPKREVFPKGYLDPNASKDVLCKRLTVRV